MQLRESPAYMAKVLRLLVRAGILRAEHGSKGGVLLNKRLDEITLLAIIEACQGTIIGSHCQDIDDSTTTCAFHKASVELRQAIVGVLSRWTLDQLACSAGPTESLPGGKQCILTGFPISLGAPEAE